jgi:hypothetical protein
MAGQVQRLSDGREFKALPGKFNQADMFDLSKRGLWNPQTEGIATVKQYDDALNVAKVYQMVLGYNWARSDAVAFSKKGFEKAPVQIGTKLVWVEEEKDLNWNKTGRLLVATLDLSKISGEKVTLANGTETTLRQAVGMGVIPLSKFVITKTQDDKKVVAYEVTVASDFDPKTDLSVKDILSPKGWTTTVDKDGYPLNGGRIPDQVGWNTESARFSSVRHSEDFLDITNLPEDSQRLLAKLGVKPEDLGYFGSVARSVGNFGDDNWRIVGAVVDWSVVSRVALVGQVAAQLGRPKSQGDFDRGRDAIVVGNNAPIVRGVEQSGATAPRDANVAAATLHPLSEGQSGSVIPTGTSATYKITEEPGKLIVEGTPEQLAAAKRKLTQ